jgi:hypothetical protein
LQQNHVSFDHFAGGCEQEWRLREAERFRGLEVDNKLKPSTTGKSAMSSPCSASATMRVLQSA